MTLNRSDSPHKFPQRQLLKRHNKTGKLISGYEQIKRTDHVLVNNMSHLLVSNIRVQFYSILSQITNFQLKAQMLKQVVGDFTYQLRSVSFKAHHNPRKFLHYCVD